MPSLAPARTYLLFDALAAHHALVRHLTLSARAGLTPALLLELLEALDLRSLTIHARGGLHNIQPVLIAVAHDAPLGTRLLHAIAHMPRLHTLAFTPETLAYSLALRRAVPCPGPLGARGLTALQTITDDLFPPVRAHAFWVALAAAKARPSSAPLRHLGTRLGSMGCGALARLLGACGAGLQTLRVDTRGPHLFDDGSAADLHAARLSFAPCTRLHTLDLTLYAAPDDPAAAQLSFAYLEHADIERAFATLDASLAALPTLRSVAWRVCGARAREAGLEEALWAALPRLAGRKGVEVNVDAV